MPYHSSTHYEDLFNGDVSDLEGVSEDEMRLIEGEDVCLSEGEENVNDLMCGTTFNEQHDTQLTAYLRCRLRLFGSLARAR